MITISRDALTLSWAALALLLVLDILVVLGWTVAHWRATQSARMVAEADRGELLDTVVAIRDYLHDSYTTQEEISKVLVEIRDRKPKD